MKKLLLGIFFSFSICLQAQDSEVLDGTLSNEFGVNATPFITTFLNFSGETANNSNYSFIYKKYISPTKALRYGLNGSFSNEKANNDEDERDTNYAIDLKFGFENQKMLSNKWRFYFGSDFGIGVNRSIVRIISGFDDVKTTSSDYSASLGGLYGVIFKINERVSLFTEGNLTYVFGYNKQKQEFSALPDLEQSTKSFNHNIRFNLPTAIFFAVRF